ncbi:hypothetical protein ABT121_02195 [Streptomyces sp. NPDC001928]|uniref:effector-associated constant component EACC1 n=1 Tax=Streptomyces sp. NPDC001928 TaxID=3154404 RepID=UPI00332731BD
MEHDGPREVLLRLTSEPGWDEDDTERAERRLRAELRELDVESIRSVTVDRVPGGAKAVDPVTVGAIVVALSASGGVLTALVETLRDWLARQSARHRVELTMDGDTIVLERPTPGERQALIDAYICRHADGRGSKSSAGPADG